MVAFTIGVNIQTLLTQAEAPTIEYNDRVRLICDLIRMRVMATRLPVGVQLHRVSRLAATETGWPKDVRLPERIGRLGAAPPEKCQPGRANRKGQSRFYCCSDMAGALQETRVTCFDNYDVSAGEVLILSTWETTRPLCLLALGFCDESFLRVGSTRRPTVEQLNHYAKLDNDAQTVQLWLDRMFTTKVEASSDGTSDSYAIQYAIADAAFAVGRDLIQGITYPSSRHRNMGVDNYVFEPDVLKDGLRLAGADAQQLLRLEETGAGYVTLASLAPSYGENLHWLRSARLLESSSPRGSHWEAWNLEELSTTTLSRLTPR